MIPRWQPPTDLIRLAELQAGVLSTAQVRYFGASGDVCTRMTRASGPWQLIARGLILTTPGPPSWEARAWGGVLLGRDGARLGGTAAGYLWKLVDEPPEIITVLVDDERRLRAREGWRFVRESPMLRQRSRGSPPRTTVEDTVLDLCDSPSSREMVGYLTTAVQKGLTTPNRLLTRLSERGRHQNARAIRALLAETADGAESVLEVDYLRKVERAHGLPRGVRQVRTGTTVQDVRYDPYRVVVELDGQLGHSGTGKFRDMNRDNASAVRGDVTLRFGWTDVHDRSCEAAWQVGSVLAGRGWTGMPSRCPRCLNVPLEELWAA